MSTPALSVKLRYPVAKNYAERFLLHIKDHVLRAEIAGSLRRKVEEVGDIEIVCIENPNKPLSLLFKEGYPGMVMNGPRLKRFFYPDRNLKIELFITTKEDWGRIFAIRTGSAWYSHAKLAVRWNRLGWCGTEDGLRRKKDCVKVGNKWRLKKDVVNPTLPPPFYEEEDFYRFLGLEWEPPEKRSWADPTQNKQYSFL